MALAGLLVVAAVIRTETSSFPEMELITLAQSSTRNHMNQVCVLVEAIVTEANKLACSVLFLLS